MSVLYDTNGKDHRIYVEYTYTHRHTHTHTGVAVENLPHLDDIEVMKRLDSRGQHLQEQLKEKYLPHAYHGKA